MTDVAVFAVLAVAFDVRAGSFMHLIQSSLHFHGWFNGAVSFVVCVLLLPPVLRMAMHWQIHDLPGELKLHTIPTPRLGGVAMGGALLLGMSIGWTGLFLPAWSIFVAFLLVWTIGLIDDLRGLSPGLRLSAQIFAGLLVARSDWRLVVFGNVFIDAILTCLFVMLFINAFNFFDGADGLAAGVANIVSLGYALYYSTRAPSVGAAISWSLLGTSAAFLLFNFPPAKIFMGDSGSTVLGFLLAFIGLDFYKVHHAIGTHLLLPLIFAGLPLLDLFLAVFRRMRNGSSPFLGDRQHLYDLLRQQGWSARPIAFGSYLATALLVLLGWFCNHVNPLVALIAVGLTFGSLLITAVRLGSLR
jgi:UDP-GlcNAc:undecaprenyl-phosphate/decaprenyl-phosphate GlcNAc-1-phosphate transferase